MVTLVCWNCNKEIDVEFLEDITDCPNCGEKISRDISKYSSRRTGRKKRK